MLNPTERAFRISKLDPICSRALNALSATPKSLAALATAFGLNQDVLEKNLSLLVDEGLCARTIGDRITATYKLA
jgi:hypothetical protein